MKSNAEQLELHEMHIPCSSLIYLRSRKAGGTRRVKTTASAASSLSLLATQAFEAWRSDAVDACAAVPEMGPVLVISGRAKNRAELLSDSQW